MHLPPPALSSKPTSTPRPSPDAPWPSPPTFVCTPMNISPSKAFPLTSEPAEPKMTTFSPREIVSELDRFIIGQADAKRAVGIGLVREKRRKEVSARAELAAEERVLDALVGKSASPTTRDNFRKRLRA